MHTVFRLVFTYLHRNNIADFLDALGMNTNDLFTNLNLLPELVFCSLKILWYLKISSAFVAGVSFLQMPSALPVACYARHPV